MLHLESDVEIVLDRRLAAAGDNWMVSSTPNWMSGLLTTGKYVLLLSIGRGQEAGAESGCGKTAFLTR